MDRWQDYQRTSWIALYQRWCTKCLSYVIASRWNTLSACQDTQNSGIESEYLLSSRSVSAWTQDLIKYHLPRPRRLALLISHLYTTKTKTFASTVLIYRPANGVFFTTKPPCLWKVYLIITRSNSTHLQNFQASSIISWWKKFGENILYELCHFKWWILGGDYWLTIAGTHEDFAGNYPFGRRIVVMPYDLPPKSDL